MTALLLIAILTALPQEMKAYIFLIALSLGLYAAGTWYLRQLGMELDRRIEEHRRRRAP
jgi:hypothetical protein